MQNTYLDTVIHTVTNLYILIRIAIYRNINRLKRYVRFKGFLLNLQHLFLFLDPKSTAHGL